MAWQQTSNGMDYLPAPDRLWRNASAPLVARYSLLGIELEVGTNAPALAELADEVFGQRIPGEPGVKPMRLRAFLHDVPEDARASTTIMRIQNNCLHVVNGGSFGVADRPTNTATTFVTPAMLEDTLTTQVTFLECLAMFLVSQERPVTLHAAALIHNARCVLVTGIHGAGKSTLAYACLRAGFGLLAEDVVFAAEPAETQIGPLEIWGNPQFLHLMPNSTGFFPELATAHSVRQLNGERKMRIRVPALREDAAVPHHAVWGVCSLGRSCGPGAMLVPPDCSHIRHALTHFTGDPPVDRRAMDIAADRLLAGRAAHLVAGADPADAVDVLRRWMEG